jgi:hypothetical protein
MGRSAAAQRTSEELLTMSDTASNGPFPLMAVAGAAMHRGSGAVALRLAQRAHSEIAASGGRGFESTVMLAIAHAQLGQLDEALAAIESVPEFGLDHPFTRAAAALVAAATGSPKEAIEHAEIVVHLHGATYLDQVFAYVAAAGASAQLGDGEQAALAAEAAVARAIGVGDVVAIGLATGVYAAVTGETHPAHDSRTQLGDGWTTVLHWCADANPWAQPAASAGE